MENLYRTAVGILYFFQFGALLYFYKRTGDTKVLHDTCKETPLLVACRSIWAAAVIVTIALYLISPVFLAWSNLHWGNTARTIGVLLGIGADLFIVWVLISLGKNISAALKVRDNQQYEKKQCIFPKIKCH
jgi:protein-S-isoprenylcysteine O-methyltransferase Ste14